MEEDKNNPELDAIILQNEQQTDAMKEMSLLLEGIHTEIEKQDPNPALEAILLTIDKAEPSKEIVEQLKEIANELKARPENSIQLEIEDAEIVDVRGEQGPPGKDADESKIIKEVLAKMPKPENGTNGKDGTTPVKGKDYFTGDEVDEFLKLATPVKGRDYNDGKDADEKKIVGQIIPQVLAQIQPPMNGTHGEDGKDGSPDTPEEIASKLNSFPNSINANVIRGIPTKEEFLDYVKNLTGKKRLSIKDIEGFDGAFKLRGVGSFIQLQDVPQSYVGQVGKSLRVNSTATGLEFYTPSGGGGGSVTNFSFTNANGISGVVTNPTTIPNLTLSLGAITPTSVAASGAVTGSNLSGTNTGDETQATIKTKLGPASAGVDGYLTGTDWSTFNGKFTLPSLTSGSVLFSNGTTIAQDNNELFFDDTNNRFNVGTNAGTAKMTISRNTTAPPTPTGDTVLHLVGNDSLSARFLFDCFGASVPRWTFRRARGTNASPSALLANDVINTFSFDGHDGTAYSGTRLTFTAHAAENWVVGANGTYATWSTTPIGGTIAVERMRLDDVGRLGIGVTSSTAFLHLKGGTATAGTASAKINSGTLLAVTEAGAIENDGTHLYYTATNGGTRYQLDQQPGTGTVTSVASADGSINVTNPTTTVDLAVVQAPKLTTARTIGGVSFDGTANIKVGPINSTNMNATTSAELAGVISDETGSGALVFANSPTLVTPALGTPSSVTLTNGTGLPISTGVAGLGAGIATFLATPSSVNLASAVTDETGSGALVFATNPTLVTPTLGVASVTSVNGNSITSGTGTLTLSTFTLTATGNASVQGTNTGDQNLFGIIAVSGQSNVVADTTNDTLTLVAGTNITITTDATTDSITINAATSSTGITRTVSSISTSQTAAAAASTDYVYLVTGTTTLTLPTAVGNTNLYTVKRNDATLTTTIDTTGGQTIDGVATQTLLSQYESMSFISDNSNWFIA